MTVFGLTHSRSRELYDLSILATRLALYSHLPPRPLIAPGQLIGSRSGWMARFKPLLDDQEFSKFVRLTWGLSPFVLVMICPQSRSRRQDRNPPITRENLLWIINGHPDALPLFNEG